MPLQVLNGFAAALGRSREYGRCLRRRACSPTHPPTDEQVVRLEAMARTRQH
jgi:hypothetical protein